MENREMFDELNALVGMIAKALEIKEEDAVKGLEDGSIHLRLGEDEEGQRFVAATRAGKTAFLYPGAIKHAPEGEKEEAAPAGGGGCGGHGGCGCGH